MSLKSQNISNKWEQKYIKYKLKYNAIVKQIDSLVGGDPFSPVYKKYLELCINYELVDTNLIKSISTSSLLDNNLKAYNLHKLDQMYIHFIDLFFNTEHKIYQDFLKSNKDIKLILTKIIKDKIKGLKLLNYKNKKQFEIAGDQEIYLSCCFKLSGNPSQVFSQIVEDVVKIFSSGKKFNKHEYTVNGKKIVGLVIDNIEFACYQKIFEEKNECMDIRVAKIEIEDNNVIDKTELDKIPNIPAPINNIETLFNTVITMSWGE